MTGVLDSILDIFSSVASWIAEAVASLVPMFYDAETGLTFIGCLTIIGLAVSVGFLLVGVIQNFMNFRS